MIRARAAALAIAITLLLAQTISAGAPLGEGYLVWESNRTGAWRLWRQGLDGKGLRQLTPDERGREHCCAHISPDGTAVAWLSGAVGSTKYPDDPVGELRLTRLADGVTRVLAPAARTYKENRAVVWIDDGHLVYIDSTAGTTRLDLASGRKDPLLPGVAPDEGWLVGPTERFAVTGYPPRFSPYDRARRSSAGAMPRGGCQPYFSHDGRWGFWASGAGGPISRIELESGTVSRILGKNDARLPSGWGYLYFPMVSRSAELMAWGASEGKHDHFASDYEIFAAALDPATLEISGPVVRLTDHRATDRYPDIWARPGSVTRSKPAVSAITTATPAARPGWPASAEGLVWLFDAGNRPNLVAPLRGEPAAPPRAWPPRARGRAWTGADYALELRGGWFELPPELGARATGAAMITNTLSLEAEITPADRVQRAPIVALAERPGRHSFLLVQDGDALVLHLALQTAASSPRIALPKDAATRGVHIALSYEPGRLLAWIDGEPALASEAVQGDFFHWKTRMLALGSVAGHDPAWRGRLSGLALWNRMLDTGEVRDNRARRQVARSARPRVATVTARATLRARSRIPTLAEISPYREALAVFEYEIASATPPFAAGERVRVAHFVLLDGGSLPAAARASDTVHSLRLEPFADHPELESLYIADDLPPATGNRDLQYDPGL